MMKKFCLLCTAMALLVCLTFSTALAANLSILHMERENEDAPYPYADNVVTIGDTAYILTHAYYNGKIMRWQDGMTEAELWADNLFYGGNFGSMDEVKEQLETDGVKDADPEHAVRFVFTDGRRLLALNHLNGRIFAITSDNGKAAYEDLATVQDMKFLMHEGDGYSYMITPTSVVGAGDHLLMLIQDWDDNSGKEIKAIYVISLQDGSVKTASVKDAELLTAYKDGKAVALIRSSNFEDYYDEDKDAYKPADVFAYDPATDKTEKLGEFAEQTYAPRMLLYSEKLNAFVYPDNSRIKSVSTDFKTTKQVGYLPDGYIQNAAIVGDSLVTLNGIELSDEEDGGVMIRTLDPNFKADEYLTYYGGLYEAFRAFTKAYPQVPVYVSEDANSTDANALWLLMQSGGEDMPDVLSLPMSYSVFTKLLEKGACADLSGYPELKAYADALYPVYREALSGENGEIWAIPTNVYSYDGVSISKKVMEEMGLTLEDIPTNLVDLCAFLNRWNDEFAEEFSKYNAISYVSKYRDYMFRLMFDDYIEYYAANGLELKFDTPLFRELMAALDSLKVDELERSVTVTEQAQSDYKQGLFYIGEQVIGTWADYSREDSDRIVIPMSLTKDTQHVEGAEITVAFINPKSAHKEYAAKFLQFEIENPDDWSAYALRADLTEPLENKYYQENIESYQEWVAEAEKALAEASEEEKADAQMYLEDAQKALKDYEENERWRISSEALQYYRENVLPTVYVKTPTFLDSSSEGPTEEFNSIVNRYRDGQIKSVDQFIKEIDSKLWMMQQGG